MVKRNYHDSQEDVPGPGYHRLRDKAGDAYETLRQDTVRRQREAMEAVAPHATVARDRGGRRDTAYPPHHTTLPRTRARLVGDGLAVHAARRAMGLTQDKFAAMLDVQRTTVSTWEQMRVLHPKVKRNIEYRLQMKVFQ